MVCTTGKFTVRKGSLWAFGGPVASLSSQSTPVHVLLGCTAQTDYKTTFVGKPVSKTESDWAFP